MPKVFGRLSHAIRFCCALAALQGGLPAFASIESVDPTPVEETQRSTDLTVTPPNAVNLSSEPIDAPLADPIAKSERAERVSARMPLFFQEGLATWYGPRFHGKRTANGERYDMNSLTAAHPTLPFGTKILVRNLHNGREVVVRINDRGPYAQGVIIDLSRAAASALELLAAGVRSVELSSISSIGNSELKSNSIHTKSRPRIAARSPAKKHHPAVRHSAK